ncbi:hypothetical protein D3C78_1367930 [compost metagenome]
MLAAGAETGAGHGADDHRYMGLAARHEAQLGRMVDDHVHGHGGEVHQHDLGDRAHADDGGADGGTDDRLLGNRRGTHARIAVLAGEATGHADDAPLLLVADVLAEHDDVLIRGHGVVERQVDRLNAIELGCLAHTVTSSL